LHRRAGSTPLSRLLRRVDRERQHPHAYYRAVSSFFAWLDQHGIGELPDIEPFHVAAYLKALRVSEAADRAVRERVAAKPTIKQHLAAIRMLFDWLVVGQVLALNPAHAVRGRPGRRSMSVKRGRGGSGVSTRRSAGACALPWSAAAYR
jgi:site-specific recombinase XerD